MTAGGGGWKEDLLTHLFRPEEVSKGRRRRRLFAQVAPSIHRGRPVTSALPVCGLCAPVSAEAWLVGGAAPPQPVRTPGLRRLWAWPRPSIQTGGNPTSAVTPPNSSTSERFLKTSRGRRPLAFRLINLTRPSSSSRRPFDSAGGERAAAARRVVCFVCVCAKCVCKPVTAGGDKFCTPQPLTPGC